jgi:hypothetical protein
MARMEEHWMKASIYRIFGSAAAVSALALVLGAPKKWG